jgi:hypothetical protein
MFQILDLIIPALTYIDEINGNRIRHANLRIIKYAHDMLSNTSLREYHLIRNKLPSNYSNMSRDEIVNAMRNALINSVSA